MFIMLETLSRGLNHVKTQYVQPTGQWVKGHKLVVATTVLAAIVAFQYYRAPEQMSGILKFNAKALTVVFPLAYTALFPLVSLVHVMSVGSPDMEIGRSMRGLCNGYYQSIPRVWQTWLEFVKA